MDTERSGFRFECCHMSAVFLYLGSGNHSVSARIAQAGLGDRSLGSPQHCLDKAAGPALTAVNKCRLLA